MEYIGTFVLGFVNKINMKNKNKILDNTIKNITFVYGCSRIIKKLIVK